MSNAPCLEAPRIPPPIGLDECALKAGVIAFFPVTRNSRHGRSNVLFVLVAFSRELLLSFSYCVSANIWYLTADLVSRKTFVLITPGCGPSCPNTADADEFVDRPERVIALCCTAFPLDVESPGYPGLARCLSKVLRIAGSSSEQLNKQTSAEFDLRGIPSSIRKINMSARNSKTIPGGHGRRLLPAAFLIALFATSVASLPAHAQDAAAEKKSDSPFAGLTFRQIGPFRGGRVTAVTGVQSDPMTYYFGATGGGIFKTVDGGMHWAAGRRWPGEAWLGGRDRGCRLRPQHRLRGHGRGRHPRQRLARRRGLQVHRRRPYLDAHGPDGHAADWRAADRSEESRHCVMWPRWVTWPALMRSVESIARWMAARPGRKFCSRAMSRAQWTSPSIRSIPMIVYAAILAGHSQALDVRERRPR